ncbi:hypothetical protein [Streptomyces sp. NPDC050759]|uniref:hypothetical protein n=1 Tax=Streptomyces sp. NPDC050759 TaxID=3365635 RepID=UPI0037985D8C
MAGREGRTDEAQRPSAAPLRARAAGRVEALRLGAQGKASLWRGLLAASAQDSRLDADRLEALLRRAEQQIRTMDALHARIATALLFPVTGQEPASTATAGTSSSR